jgi:hypothetical protein
MDEISINGNGVPRRRSPIRRIVVSRPDSAFHTVMIPLEGELKERLTADIGYLKPPRLPRPDNLRWWERLAYAWRGL